MAREVFADVRGTASAQDRDDVLRALGVAERALEEDEPQRSLAALEWARGAAPRSWAVREALGIVLYRMGRYGEARRELQAYRRMTARADQNHLLADCARAAGDHDRVQAEVDQLEASDAPAERIAEGLLVLAGDRFERGDTGGAWAALERVGLEPRRVEEHHLRAWHLAARVAIADGRPERAQELRDGIAAVDPAFLEAADAAVTPRG